MWIFSCELNLFTLCMRQWQETIRPGEKLIYKICIGPNRILRFNVSDFR